MRWIFDNLQLVLLVAGALAYWLTQRKAQRGEDEQPGGGRDFTMGDDAGEDAERTRRIQEEIRRKIAERRSGQSTPPPLAPAPQSYERPLPPPVVAPRPVQRSFPDTMRTRLEQKLEQARAIQEAAAAERQRRQQARIREVEAQELAVQHRTDELARAVRTARNDAVSQKVEAARLKRGALLSELRDPASVRRAIVLREILNPPVGLR